MLDINQLEKGNVPKFEIEKIRDEICRSLAGTNPTNQAMPLIRPIGTMGQEALLHFFELSIESSELPPGERNLAIFDNMSESEYIALKNFAEANRVQNEGGEK